MSTTVTITINGSTYTADSTATGPNVVTPETTLAQFIREHTPFKATKITCAQGGCGACTVGLTRTDPATGKMTTRPINSCLAKLFSLNNAVVTTNDGIGNSRAGYHPIQTKMAELSATQCGYCTSGFVMTLWSYLQQHPDASELELESILDGNLCRCTGYRPILDAYKSFADSGGDDDDSNLPECRKKNCCQRRDKLPPGGADIEDVHLLEHNHDDHHAPTTKQFHSSKIGANGSAVTWIDVATLTDLAYWVQHYSGLNVMLTVGATTLGIYPAEYDAYLNIGAIPDLNVLTQTASGVTIGSAVTIQGVIEYLGAVTGPNAYSTKHFPQAIAHFKRIAGHAIRCRGSIGGNLMLTYQHQSPTDFFPSDAAVVLMGLDATVSVFDTATSKTTSGMSLTQFFSQTTMSGKVLLSITIPFCASTSEVFQSYKMALRQVMSHAYVNAAMKISIDPTTHKIGPNPVVAIGGIAVVPTRQSILEMMLGGVDVTDTATFTRLAGALKTSLTAAVQPGPAAWGRMAYRVQTAVNFLYKFFMHVQPGLLPQLSKASAEWMTRPVTQASQTYEAPTAALEPVSIAMPKTDALAQCAGEAVYTADIPTPQNAVFCALVLADRACCNIVSVDTTAASAIPGYIKFYQSKDLPAANNVFNVGVLFATGSTNYAGQCIGAVVARSQEVATRCARAISAGVTYSLPTAPPIITVQDALAANPQPLFPATQQVPPVVRGDVKTALQTCTTVVSGSCDIGSQYHFHTENHAVLVTPAEGQFVVDSATQSVATVQASIATCLGVPMSDVNVRARRAGGGFGAKVTAANFAGCIAAWAARDLNLPVRLNMTLEDPQKGLGARPQYHMTYTAGLDASNKLQALSLTIYLAAGYNYSDIGFEAGKVISNIDNCYNIPNFSASVIGLQTNVAPATSVRGPGWIQSILYSEIIMNRLAAEVKMDPAAFRALNFYQNGQTAPNGQPINVANINAMWTQLQTSANVATRAANVKAFNAANRWVKRGLSMSAARFSVDWCPMNFNSTVAIYPDGSICITTGGIEIGQGLTTKVAAAVAYKLGLTQAEMLKYIKVLPSSTRIVQGPMNVTGGSITSELCCRSAMAACDTLNARLAPFKQASQPWQQLVSTAVDGAVSLLAEGWTGNPSFAPYSHYNSWGVACSEVEVDGLTGQFEVIRTDLIFDCGTSMNPAIDIGQVEGGFVMGLGWFTQEVTSWDPATGEALNAGTWEYKVPFAADTPETFNVTLLENSVNKTGVLSSKAVGEPPVSLASSVVLAIQDAINAVRDEVGTTQRFHVESVPLTVDKIAAACGVQVSNYTFA